MKLLVGILRVDEPQFYFLKEQLQRYLADNDDYFVINNLPKNEAHDLLYSTFYKNRNDFDIFLKLDADMFITDDQFIDWLKGKFENDIELDWLHFHIWDYFLEDYISGVNAYSNRVRWTANTDNLYTDRTLISSSVLKSEIVSRPSSKYILHCPDPSDEQAFNFGSHRAIKAFPRGVEMPKRNSTHGEVFFLLCKSIFLNFTRQKLIAMAAYILAVKKKVSDEFINRSSNNREKSLETLASKTNRELLIYLFVNYESYFLMLGKLGYVLLYKLKLREAK
ncbi:hypothetical protein [Roseivirga spongicola]|uniref:Glycosyltransferase 2-like domain-containing protein n=1 Tax=Roseivirga spongicola TaxID=333140 RepID=A0A150XHN2_9BACT|nr:hypothetical protein [Roseivirga spongicola]KYG78192.1 hypothetical protein AWW68_05345 [Roseivirga spongicola]WPZ11937.1 hypothetical protein T7867_07425 [Roseivirga spongicola]